MIFLQKFLISRYFPKLLLIPSVGLLFACSNVTNTVTPPVKAKEEKPTETIVTQESNQNISQNNYPKFNIPIQCNLEKDCFILLYSDRDPGPTAVDFNCGRQTYDDHKGTDFAISDAAVMAKGVPVIASAAGKVLRVRDGMIDQRVRDDSDRQNVENIECGNGLVIDHGNGWETQYCHLRQGSVKVQAGQMVETGTPLGLVGMSGLASFPHVHLTIRYQGQVVDPFVGPKAGAGCQVNKESIWNRAIAYKPTGLIRAGFASSIPDEDQVWAGEFRAKNLPANPPALLFWVQLYGVLEGDQEEYQLLAPDGAVVINEQKEIKKSSKSWLGYVGRKNNPNNPIKAGVWQGKYRLIRDGKVLVDINEQLQVGE